MGTEIKQSRLLHGIGLMCTFVWHPLHLTKKKKTDILINHVSFCATLENRTKKKLAPINWTAKHIQRSGEWYRTTLSLDCGELFNTITTRHLVNWSRTYGYSFRVAFLFVCLLFLSILFGSRGDYAHWVFVVIFVCVFFFNFLVNIMVLFQGKSISWLYCCH